MTAKPQRTLSPLVFRGPQEICHACGLNPQKIGTYVSELGMPAFKLAGNWVALPDDLRDWLREMKHKR